MKKFAMLVNDEENEDSLPAQVENVACSNPDSYDSYGDGSQPHQDETYDKGADFEKNDDRKPTHK